MRALILEQIEGRTTAEVRQISASQLPAGNVTVDVNWSSLNYKDALAITGQGKIIRQFPMVPGIDFAGTVHSSEDPRFHIGQSVLLTGWGVGENHWGGLAEQARVNGDWLVPMPDGLDARKAMIIGTAGFTAMLCVMASGGVGSTAIALLSALGYQIAAISGRDSNSDYLKNLGAQRILPRSDYLDASRPLEKQLWAGAIDTVGDSMLAKILAQMNYNGTVAACGLAGGYNLPTTVMPFILRNIRLQGVDSVMTPQPRRLQAWQRLQKILPESFYQQASQAITLADTPTIAARLLANEVTGRTLVKVR